jgi:hypothetical protein
MKIFGKKPAIYVLAVLQLFVGITALMGGYGLMADPSSAAAGARPEWLSGTPFQNYFIPGLILTIFIGIGNLAASMVTVFRGRSAGWVAAAMGLTLLVYMTTEVLLVGLRIFLQPLYFLLGMIEALIGLMLAFHARRPAGPLSGQSGKIPAH